MWGHQESLNGYQPRETYSAVVKSMRTKSKSNHMQIINYPFKKSGTITLTNEILSNSIDCELAITDIEIFQSLNYRKEKHFKKPLALIFNNPKAHSFTKLNFQFAVEQICVDHKDNKVKKIEIIFPDKNLEKNKINTTNLKSYSDYSLVILAPQGLIKSKNIQINKTKILI